MNILRKVSSINNCSINGSHYYEFHYFREMTSYSRRPAMGLIKSAMLGWERRDISARSSLHESFRKDNLIQSLSLNLASNS